MRSRPTLSVVVPNYNDSALLEGAIQAILAQSFRPLEVVIIDDGSTDNSMDIIGRFASQNDLVRVYENDRNRGILYTGNRSLSLVSGDFVMWCAADDRVLPGCFEQSMALLTTHPNAGICSGLTRVIDESNADIGVYPSPIVAGSPSFLPPERVADLLPRHGHWLTGNTTIFRREAVIEEGGFREGLNALVDAFLGQVLALKHGACFIPTILGCWRRDRESYSSRYAQSPETQEQALAIAVQLMMSERYCHVFPARYVTRWQREMRHGIAVTRMRAFMRGFEDSLGPTLSALPKPWQRLCSGVVQGFLKVVSRLAQLSLVLRYFPQFAVTRRVHRWGYRLKGMRCD